MLLFSTKTSPMLHTLVRYWLAVSKSKATKVFILFVVCLLTKLLGWCFWFGLLVYGGGWGGVCSRVIVCFLTGVVC